MAAGGNSRDAPGMRRAEASGARVQEVPSGQVRFALQGRRRHGLSGAHFSHVPGLRAFVVAERAGGGAAS